jgi:DOPA 4,5-dioxygenase
MIDRDGSAPWHAHIYFTADQREEADALRIGFEALRLTGEPDLLFVGSLRDHKVGPHPIPQFEIHFLEGAMASVRATLEASGLKVLIHPLTDDDLADHTRLGQWIGEPIELDLTVLDPPGVNQGVARFGKTDF